MSLRSPAISRFLPFEFRSLMRDWESERIRRELIPLSIAEVIAFRKAKVSAKRSDFTKVAVAEYDDDDPVSSMIHPSPAKPVEAFQAASVYMRVVEVLRGGSWLMLGGLWLGVSGGVWASVHSRASQVAFFRVSSGVNFLCWKVNWFLDIHRFQQIEAVSVPGPSPTGGRDGILLIWSIVFNCPFCLHFNVSIIQVTYFLSSCANIFSFWYSNQITQNSIQETKFTKIKTFIFMVAMATIIERYRTLLKITGNNNKQN